MFISFSSLEGHKTDLVNDKLSDVYNYGFYKDANGSYVISILWELEQGII